MPDMTTEIRTSIEEVNRKVEMSTLVKDEIVAILEANPSNDLTKSEIQKLSESLIKLHLEETSSPPKP